VPTWELAGVVFKLRAATYQKPRAMNQYSIACVSANHSITRHSCPVDPVIAWSSSAVYFCRTDSSIASDDTVRIAFTASDAMDALVPYRLVVSRSSRASERILRYPAPTMGGRPAHTTTRPRFQLCAMARMLHAARLRMEMP